jgi:hypothetical protein
VSRGQDLAHHIEDGIVLKGIADLLQLLKQPLQDMALNRVARDEIENEAVLALAVAVDASHPLLQAVRIPRDVIIEEDVADLKVDALASRFGCDQNLDRALPELLFRMQACAGLVAGTRLHAAVDAAEAKTPGLQSVHEVVQRVLELGEQEQALLGTIEEALLLK